MIIGETSGLNFIPFLGLIGEIKVFENV